MGEKAWERFLTNRDRFRVAFGTEKGKVKQIIVVQYEAEIGGEWRPLVRYDMAHGYLHQDVLHPDGTQEKSAVIYTDLDGALQQVLAELNRRWESYRRAYERRMR